MMPHIIPHPALEFWLALRRGWGRWDPATIIDKEIRGLLAACTNCEDLVKESHIAIPEADYDMRCRIRRSALPPREQELFEVVLDEEFPISDVALLFF
jgi:hypothetical protein